MKCPQEIIDKIILHSDYETIIKVRQFLSNHAYKKNITSISINDMIKYADIEALEYNKSRILKKNESIFNRVIAYATKENTNKLLEWCKKNQVTYDEFSFKVILIKNDKFVTKKFLTYLKDNNYRFITYHYNHAIRWENYEFLTFLHDNHVPLNDTITEDTIHIKSIKLLKFMVNKNMINLSKSLMYIANTMDKKYIKKATNYVPLHVNMAIKSLKSNNVSYTFIRWFLELMLFKENNIQLAETFEILCKYNIFYSVI